MSQLKLWLALPSQVHHWLGHAQQHLALLVTGQMRPHPARTFLFCFLESNSYIPLVRSTGAALLSTGTTVAGEYSQPTAPTYPART